MKIQFLMVPHALVFRTLASWRVKTLSPLFRLSRQNNYINKTSFFQQYNLILLIYLDNFNCI